MRKNWNRITIFVVVVGLAFSLIAATVMDIAGDITLGLDLRGGFEVLFEVHPPDDDQQITRELITSTIAALNNRVSAIGVSDPEIRPEGSDRIRVRLAGVEDQDEARRLLATEAHLVFTDADDNIMMGGDILRQGGSRVEFHPDTNRPVVTMQFNDPARVREVTTQLHGELMVIWMDFDPEVHSFAEEQLKPPEEQAFISAATIRTVLSNSGQIESSYWTYDEARELSNLLNAGALSVTLEEITATTVGPRLGEQAMTQTVNAGIIGGLLVLLYMIAYYRMPGIVASVTLLIYVYLILLVFNWMGAVLTLPGIAALVLGVGMAVDANILTYERIKEEMRTGKTVRSAFKAGSKRSLRTIMDANITTIIAAAVLFMIGEGAIQGFAIMLIISILLGILTAVIGSRLLLGLLITSRLFDRKPGWFGVKEGEISEL